MAAGVKTHCAQLDPDAPSIMLCQRQCVSLTLPLCAAACTKAQAQRPGVPSAAGMNGADATFDKPEEERTCKTKDLKQCPESAPGGLSLLFLDSLPSCAAFWQPLAYGSRTDLLMYCSDAAAGCVTTQCTGKDYGEVTVTNYFGASIDYIAAEYTNEWGHAICDKSTCGCFHSAVAAVPPVPHPMQPLIAVSGAILHPG